MDAATKRRRIFCIQIDRNRFSIPENYKKILFLLLKTCVIKHNAND